jgi:hypothetical protein
MEKLLSMSSMIIIQTLVAQLIMMNTLLSSLKMPGILIINHIQKDGQEKIDKVLDP